MEVPDFIAALDTKAGRDWTAAEYARVAAWWREREQEKLVWHCAARFLGRVATREDIEEVWQDFYVKLMPRARASYRPIGVGFCTYLLDVCLKNHCAQQSRRLERRRLREICWTDVGQVALSLASQTGPEATEADPFDHASQQAFVAALNAALNHRTINPLHRDAFLLRYTEQFSYAEIARILAVPEGTAKVWVHRVTARIAALLNKQGWEE